MDQLTVPMIAAIVAVVVSVIVNVITLLLNSRVTLHRERRLVIWKKEVDRLIELEELAGRLVEDIGSYRNYESMRERLAIQFEQLDAMGGRMARYPRVRQAVRDLSVALNSLCYQRREQLDDREARTNLEPSYRGLLEACDSVLGRRSL